ncbi:hypothetical protein LJR153_003680 [Paenibacillus sp. LjRoot153]|uniref:YncE family protein n=1 Tax=Paenibacillus sp. LjRoot153 TaxID=3342270 RepID=UPI003ED0CA51
MNHLRNLWLNKTVKKGTRLEFSTKDFHIRAKVIATIKVGSRPSSIAINHNTNRVYIGNNDLLDPSLSIINGNNNKVIKMIKLKDIALFMAINQKTNRIYISQNNSNSVVVINGSTNKIEAEIKVGEFPEGIAINPITNRVYVANRIEGTISVINSTNNKVISIIKANQGTRDLAINTLTNRIYANSGTNVMFVINGNTNKIIATVKVTSSPSTSTIRLDPSRNRVYIKVGEGLAVVNALNNRLIKIINLIITAYALNTKTNKIYATDMNLVEDIVRNGKINVISGHSYKVIKTINANGVGTLDVAVNRSTNHIFVTNEFSDTVSAINGRRDTRFATIKVGKLPIPVAINELTNRVYVCNDRDNTVSVIQDGRIR